MTQVVSATAIGRVAQTGTALDVVDPTDPITILAPLVAVLAAVAVAYMPRRIGQDTRLWRTIRGLLPYVDAAARDRGFYTTYEIDPAEETVGVWHGSLESLESALEAEGYRLGPLAAHKSLPDGRQELGSWVDLGDRISPGWLEALRLMVTPWQTHITLFEADDTDDQYLVTAHHERSAYSPLTAYWHLRARDYSPSRGVEIVSEHLADRERFEVLTNTPDQL